MSSTPRRKRFNRQQRLQSAEKWIPTYNGKNLVRGYKKWYGVDFIYAIKELEMLNYEIDPKYKKQILQQEKAKRKAAEKQNKKEDDINYDQNANFYYIAGYTSAGFPYGVTWEEYERDIKGKEDSDYEDESNQNNYDSTSEVPF